MKVGLEQQHLTILKASTFFNDICCDAERFYLVTNIDGRSDEYLKQVVKDFKHQNQSSPQLLLEQPQQQQQQKEPKKSWKLVGKTNQIVELMEKYPPTHYIFGSTYNSKNIEELVLHTWNKGLRLFFKAPYLMGDRTDRFQWGVAGWFHGLEDMQDKNKWIQFHQSLDANGHMVRIADADQQPLLDDINNNNNNNNDKPNDDAISI
ncbi:hypothetical protein DFA_05086 [Cavenderia fasciculata]|uniref:Uncharacterized protein n=1 Tax=Cavenderia fasciculata TaxID=261658 RepID=F4PNA3_CACFS|nr:uncharacterized protein DFA_05086 [Cavenderia fasciculata]EGG22956.1 hypothetical protein DFA_05086 [Cavenderia fasciculata]|eukprot:XP_004360807.1 hypothetical protein DFA_05086 [Cavenderia fasciculata]